LIEAAVVFVLFEKGLVLKVSYDIPPMFFLLLTAAAG